MIGVQRDLSVDRVRKVWFEYEGGVVFKGLECDLF